MDTRRRSTTTARAFNARRRQARRGHFFRAKAERPYAPSPEALTFKPTDVSVSVGDA